jgi:oxalate decarboxylase
VERAMKISTKLDVNTTAVSAANHNVEKRSTNMSQRDTSDNKLVGRRLFLGTAAATLGVGTAQIPHAFAQATTRSDDTPGATDVSKKRGDGSRHITSMAKKLPYFENSSGSVVAIDASDLQIMSRLSIRRLLLVPQGVREPHWHPNANELGYCLRGNHLVTIVGDDTRNSFTISAGEMYFVQSGALHGVENIGREEGEVIIAFTHERPEDLGLSGTFGSFTDSVLGNTFGLPSSAFTNLKRTPRDTIIGRTATTTVGEFQDKETNKYKYPLRSVLPQISSAAGSAYLAESGVWPILDHIAMYLVTLTGRGMREVHWHPDTAEMGYVSEGKGRMTILSPGGSIDTYEMNPNDVYFIPRAYPHHIENIADSDLKLLVFFDQGMPGDIGATTLPPGYSRDVLAATFNADPSVIPNFPFVVRAPLIVPRINPVDPA